MKKMVVLTGAGMSAESGLQTFRDANGLWEGHNVMDVATPEAFERDPKLVLEFYNQRRRQLLNVFPNNAHHNLKELEKYFNIHIITQNVDDLHERAGSSQIVHLHGELRKVRSTTNEKIVLEWSKDLYLGDVDKNGDQLRPHIVWFGEAVPQLENAIEITKQADVLVIIGTSMQVYPAASLIHYVSSNTPIYFIDPAPSISKNTNTTIIKSAAQQGTKQLIKMLVG
ncbi:MAG: NAD-dependent deacylase [Flavobacteriaceae bacterium]|nr:NAD-dependent deacylase [Flavobacteriaceae bacterium]MDG2274673.1 NAD-dependent deacylase [Flavobacteriaceae bacterium]|tara:strand:+ start:21 stop:698 length:678 start_codon:yes stop_codon:yes gene_type:complete